MLTACFGGTSYEKPPKLDSVQDAVSVRVSAVSVARWEDYVDALQAQFTLTPEGALALALPQTSLAQSSNASAVAFGAQLGTPTAPASTLPAQTPPSSTGIAGPTGTLQSDALTNYNAGNDIYEEVQALNRSIRDGALRYGYVPYVARIQVSVMPLARNEPYDVYLDLSLFSTCKGGRDDESLPTVVVPLLITDDIEKSQATDAENISRQLALNLAGTGKNIAGGASLSDLRNQFKSILANNFNSLFMVSSAAENVLEVRIGAATSANIKSGFVMLAQTHNITLLVLVKREHAAVSPGRCVPTPESVRDASERGIAINEGPVVQISSMTRLRDVRSGKELENKPRKMLDKARAIAQRFPGGDPHSLSDADLSTLAGLVEQAEFTDFRAKLAPSLRVYAVTLWTGLSTVLTMGDYDGAQFNLPYRAVPPGLQAQTVFISDNCKDTATVSLMGFTEYVAGQFLASLELHDGEYTVAATAVAQNVAGSPLTISFPTLHGLSRDLPEARNVCSATASSPVLPIPLDGAKLILRRLVDNRWSPPSSEAAEQDPSCLEQCVFEFKSVVLDGTASLAQTVGLSADADTIIADPTTGVGKLRLFVKSDKDLDSVTIAFSGAAPSALPTVTGAATVTPLNGGLSVLPSPATASSPLSTGPFVLDVPLQGLVVGRVMTISGTGIKNKKPTTGSVPVIVVPIIAPTNAAKAAPAGPS